MIIGDDLDSGDQNLTEKIPQFHSTIRFVLKVTDNLGRFVPVKTH